MFLSRTSRGLIHERAKCVLFRETMCLWLKELSHLVAHPPLHRFREDNQKRAHTHTETNTISPSYARTNAHAHTHTQRHDFSLSLSPDKFNMNRWLKKRSHVLICWKSSLACSFYKKIFLACMFLNHPFLEVLARCIWTVLYTLTKATIFNAGA